MNNGGKIMKCIGIWIICLLSVFIGISRIRSHRKPVGIVYSDKQTNAKTDASIILVSGEDEEIGRIYWKDGVMHFDGKADKSARLLLEEFGQGIVNDCRKQTDGKKGVRN